MAHFTIRRWLHRLLPSAGAIRLSIYFSCVFIGLAFWASRAVRADVGEAGLAAGRQLSQLEDLTHDAESLVVNGQHFSHSVVYTPDSVSRVLDRFQEQCQRSPNFLGQALQQLPAAAKARLASLPEASRSAFMRDEAETGGMVACFSGSGGGSVNDLGARLREFSKAHDLSVFGKLRYTYAERKGSRTRVITLWTDAGLNLAAMFPAQGDAAGTDSAIVPRPPSARRTLSAAAEGMPFALRVYQTTQSVGLLQRFYDRILASRQLFPAPGASADGTTAYQRADGYQVFVTIDGASDKSFVTLTEAGSMHGSSVLTLTATPEDG